MNFIYFGLERRFYVLESRKRHFPGLSCLKKIVGQMAILGPKPWVNPFRKMSIFHFLNVLFFWPRKAFFRSGISSISQYRPGKRLLRYSRTKKCLSRLEKQEVQSRKIDIFLKGLTHGFGEKIILFSTFFFRQYRPGKCLLRYSRTKKCVFTL